MTLNDPHAAGPEPDGRESIVPLPEGFKMRDGMLTHDLVKRTDRAAIQQMVTDHLLDGQRALQADIAKLQSGEQATIEALRAANDLRLAGDARLERGQRSLADDATAMRAEIARHDAIARDVVEVLRRLNVQVKALRVCLFVAALAVAGLAAAVIA